MSKYRKKPVVIEAMQLDGTSGDRHAVYQWIENNTLGSFEPMEVIEGRKPYPASGVSIDPRDGRLIISTLEGLHWADVGDWIIRGVQGEFYPCKPDIFEETYEAVMDEASRAPQPTDDEREALRLAVQGVLWNASNYPERVQPHLFGQDVRPLTESVMAAILAAGFRRAPAEPATQDESRPQMSEHTAPTGDEREAWVDDDLYGVIDRAMQRSWTDAAEYEYAPSEITAAVRTWMDEQCFRRGAPAEPTVATKPAIDEVRKYIEALEDWEAQPHVLEELLSALDDIPDCETWTAVPHEEHVPAEPAVQGEPTDAQVLVALNTWYAKEREQNGWPIGSNATELADYSPQAQDRMRAALRAAFVTRGTNDEQ